MPNPLISMFTVPQFASEAFTVKKDAIAVVPILNDTVRVACAVVLNLIFKYR